MYQNKTHTEIVNMLNSPQGCSVVIFVHGPRLRKLALKIVPRAQVCRVINLGLTYFGLEKNNLKKF